MYQIQQYQSGLPGAWPDFSEPGFFFNEEKQLKQQDSGGFQLLTALNQGTNQADARCALFIDNQLAISPKMAPFGSVEFVESLPELTLMALLDALEQAVIRLGLPALRLTNYPRCYAPRQADRLARHLRRRGYEVTNHLINFHLAVTPDPLLPRLHPSERRRLAMCRRAGFRVMHWADAPPDVVVEFIRQSREAQHYPLSMAPHRLADRLRTCPDQYPVFAVFDGPILAALTVAVRVRADILYNFLPADNLAYRRFSPAVLLTQGLYAYCQQAGITLLDLGVSVDEHQQPKPGLMRFKRHLGASESSKLVWEKRF